MRKAIYESPILPTMGLVSPRTWNSTILNLLRSDLLHNFFTFVSTKKLDVRDPEAKGQHFLEPLLLLPYIVG